MEIIMRANQKKMEEEKMISRKEWEETFLQVGEKRGMEIGAERMSQLAVKLIAADRLSDISRAVRNRVFRQEMYEEFGIGKSV